MSDQNLQVFFFFKLCKHIAQYTYRQISVVCVYIYIHIYISHKIKTSFENSEPTQLNLGMWNESHSVMSSCLWPHGLYSPWNSPGQNTGVGSLSLLHGIFPTQGSESRSPSLQMDSLPTEPQWKPKNTGVSSLSLLQWIFLPQELNQASLVVQRLKHLPPMQETWVRSLGREDPLEKG